MRIKILNILLIFTSLFGYLEWGGNNHIFIFKAEAEIISKLFSSPLSAIHPLTIIPFLGQILLLITVFQKMPNKFLSYLGLAGLGLLLGFMFVIGLMSLNFKILCSTLPFILVSILAIIHLRRINFAEK